MSGKHTAWEVGQAGVGVVAVYSTDKRRREPICIFGMPSANDEGWDEFKDAAEHARLIAAAPELLEALIAYHKHFGPLEDNIMLNEDCRNCAKLARSALRKASGEG